METLIAKLKKGCNIVIYKKNMYFVFQMANIYFS